MASKKRQTHDSFLSHKLTLKSAGILLQKKWAWLLVFSFPFALPIVNITHRKSFENGRFVTWRDIL
jgi:hypothetical protein